LFGKPNKSEKNLLHTNLILRYASLKPGLRGGQRASKPPDLWHGLIVNLSNLMFVIGILKLQEYFYAASDVPLFKKLALGTSGGYTSYVRVFLISNRDLVFYDTRLVVLAHLLCASLF
jgi:hypothetical protein